MERTPKQYWIRPEGISKPCVHHAAVYTEQDLALAENKEFVQEGVHVIDYWAYNQAIYELDKARSTRDKALAERDRAEKALEDERKSAPDYNG